MTVPVLPHPTLPGSAYWDAGVWEHERAAVFYRNWFYAGRAERMPAAGSWITVDVAGESVLVVRGDDAVLRGFYNVCRHRGSRLCDEPAGTVGSRLRCPYHAWSYSLDGRLVSTPNVGRGELDRAALSLWPVHVDTWQGNVFVHLGDDGDPEPLRDWLAAQVDEPLALERFGLDELRTGHVATCTVAANWKIVLENYNECLHCPTVHPELVAAVPAYRRGGLSEEGRDDGGVELADGRTSLQLAPGSRLPLLPRVHGRDAGSYFGVMVYPNMFIDVSGTAAIVTAVLPEAPDRCRLVSEYLFAPDTIAAPGFDPAPVVDFNTLVVDQDNAVCERVQRGVRSRAFTAGVLPAKDELIRVMHDRYRRDLAAVPAP